MTIALVVLAAAATAGAFRVSADAGACPGAKSVEANVASLIGASEEERTAEIVDLGERYRVIVGKSVRELVDEDRRCEERARAAAVFIALVLEKPSEAPKPARPAKSTTAVNEAPAAAMESPPPVIVSEAPSAATQSSSPASEAPSLVQPSPPPPSEAPSLAQPAPPPPREAGRVVRPSADPIIEPAIASAPSALELQLALLAALPFGSFTGSPAGFAAAARAAWTPGALGLSAGIGVTPAIALDFDSTRVRLHRVPIDASLRVHHAFGPLDAAAETGAVAAILSVAGDDAGAPAAGLRLELGLRAALIARADLGSFAPFLAAEATVVPAPYEVATHRDGSLGHTPSFWLAFGAGVSWTVD